MRDPGVVKTVMRKQITFRGPWNEVSMGPDIRIGFVRVADFIKTNLINVPFDKYQVSKNIVFQPETFSSPFFSPAEIKTVNRFKALKKQIEWLCGRFAVKKMASSVSFLPNDYSRVTIDYELDGAPYLTEYPDLPISISHSGGYAACALSRDSAGKIGIDIEKIDPCVIEHIFKVAFTDREQSILKRCSDAAVFEAWTAKEAYLKYIKKGFHESLKQVEVINGRIYHHRILSPVTLFSGGVNNEYALSLVYPIGPKMDCSTPA